MPKYNNLYKRVVTPEFNMKREITFVSSTFLLILLLTSFAFALTGSIGNARAVLEADVGDDIDRTIRVINNNNVSVRIEIFSSGDLEKDIEIIDNNFTLAPGEEKKARFTIHVSKAGTTESNINVKFSPIEGGNGVGMSSTIIINAGKKGFFEGFGEEEEQEEEENSNPRSEVTGSVTGNGGVGTEIIVIIVLAILLIFFILLEAYLLFKKKNGKNKSKNNNMGKSNNKGKTKLKKEVKKK